jgi:hypothetical protein
MEPKAKAATANASVEGLPCHDRPATRSLSIDAPSSPNENRLPVAPPHAAERAKVGAHPQISKQGQPMGFGATWQRYFRHYDLSDRGKTGKRGP